MSKKERERQVLIGLVDYFIRTGKPVGSHTLQSEGFESLSSATIRNYFVGLEKEEYLQQQYVSGGRLPTEKAFRFYASHILKQLEKNQFNSAHFSFNDTQPIGSDSSRAIATYLQAVANQLTGLTTCAAFLSAPRFDHDFIIDIKLVSVDAERCLCVILTDFGLIQTEVLPIPRKLSTFSIKRIESYFQARLAGQPLTIPLDQDEELIAQQFYNELIIRHLVSYTNFSSEYLYSTGFAQLLYSSEFFDLKKLSTSLSLFEDQQSLRRLVQSACQHGHVKIWIGKDLAEIGCPEACCTVIAIPYRIHQQVVGAIGLLGPMRIPYKETISTLYAAAQEISEALTRTVYKFKITYRQPKHEPFVLEGQEQKLLANIPYKKD